MSWKLSVFLIALHFISIRTVAQVETYKPFYVELHIGPLLNFASHAEIKGGYDSISHDKQEHLKPAYKGSTSPGVVLGYAGNKWALQGTINYFQQDITLVKTYYFNTDGPKLATGNFISTRVSALYLIDKFKRWPYGLYSGIFIGTVSSISYAVDPAVKATYGISDISYQTQMNWGFEGNLSFAIGKKGFFGNVVYSLTMPGSLGGVGKIQTDSSGYTIVDDTIKMYTMNISAGVGLRIGKLKPVPF